jgi:hypothetical protein
MIENLTVTPMIGLLRPLASPWESYSSFPAPKAPRSFATRHGSTWSKRAGNNSQSRI